MPMPLAARARFHRSATSAPRRNLAQHGRQSAGGQRQTHLAFGPTQVGEVKRDKSTKSRLDICEKEIRPVERVPVSRRDGRAQRLTRAAITCKGPVCAPAQLLAEPIAVSAQCTPHDSQRGRLPLAREKAAFCQGRISGNVTEADKPKFRSYGRPFSTAIAVPWNIVLLNPP